MQKKRHPKESTVFDKDGEKRRGAFFAAHRPGRREVLSMATAAIAAGGLMASPAEAHHTKGHHDGESPAAWKRHAGLVKALNECEAMSLACLDHCIGELASGDSSLEKCAARVRETMSLCSATRSLVLQGSPLVPAALELCAQACRGCQEECEKHRKHHEVCGACADSCRQVRDEIARI